MPDNPNASPADRAAAAEAAERERREAQVRARSGGREGTVTAGAAGQPLTLAPSLLGGAMDGGTAPQPARTVLGG
ncbi:hypothetical protein J4558_00015 [Leptolyngbya sp. 15MV]|nr:hypothetical protein J4558_00015 [Leptolyngbya sp. 15MV]